MIAAITTLCQSGIYAGDSGCASSDQASKAISVGWAGGCHWAPVHDVNRHDGDIAAFFLRPYLESKAEANRGTVDCDVEAV